VLTDVPSTPRDEAVADCRFRLLTLAMGSWKEGATSFKGNCRLGGGNLVRRILGYGRFVEFHVCKFRNWFVQGWNASIKLQMA
jgi:hypothetical protein